MSTETTEVFDSKILTQITPFSVIWTATSSIKKPTKAGGLYEKKVVVCESALISEPIQVEMTRNDYESLRIMHMKGISMFAATQGVENTKGYRNLIFSGAKQAVIGA